MDHAWNQADEAARGKAIRPVADGFTGRWRDRYDDFVALCLEQFAGDRIILVRSHVPQFSVGWDGDVEVLPGRRRAARFLEALDEHFARSTSCLVSDAALSSFPVSDRWTFPDDLRVHVERDVVRLCAETPASQARTQGEPVARRLRAGCRPRVRARCTGRVLGRGVHHDRCRPRRQPGPRGEAAEPAAAARLLPAGPGDP